MEVLLHGTQWSMPCHLISPHLPSHTVSSDPLISPVYLFLTPLLLMRLPSLSDSVQYLLPILVCLQLCHDNFARMDTDRYALPVRLLAVHTFDANEVFEAVDGGDFAFAALVGAAHDGYFVVFADGD